MKKRSLIVTVFLLLYIPVFFGGTLLGYHLPKKQEIVEYYNEKDMHVTEEVKYYPRKDMYVTVEKRWGGKDEGFPEMYRVSQIKEDSIGYAEGNLIDVHTDENTRITWRGHEIGEGKLQPGDFVKVTFQEGTTFEESYPMGINKPIIEIEYLGNKNYLK